MHCSAITLCCGGVVWLLSAFVLADVPHLWANDTASVMLWESGALGPLPNQTFLSSDVRAPIFMIHTFDRDRVSSSAGSHIFLSAAVGRQRQSPMILSARDLSVVYIDPTWNGGGTANYQRHRGQDSYLTFWTGKGHVGWGAGGCILLDERYHIVRNITTTRTTGYLGFEGADNHECELTHDGGALITVYYKRNFHLDVTSPAAGGGDGSGDGVSGSDELGLGPGALIRESAFQEIDIETGEARFTWTATDHFAFDESLNPYAAANDANASAAAAVPVSREEAREEEEEEEGGGWDWFHLNSVQKTPAGDYLVSARHLCVLALVSGRDGSVVWRLGGKHSDFADLAGGDAADFCFQHHARFVFSGDDDDDDDDEGNEGENGKRTEEIELTLFDNHAMHATSLTPGCKRDCSRALRLRLDLAAMTVDIVHSWTHPQSVQAWAQGGVQALPGKARRGRRGRGRGGAMIGWGTVPSFSEVDGEGTTVLELGGRDPRVLTSLGVRAPRAGFETEIQIPESDDVTVVQIAALDVDGNELGFTDVVDARGGTKLTPDIQL
ncbi:ASST-domain-containing protein [Microdochium trichocladiopsis]|uniref:ASST-domain-containing protein n=1 Tax=Microdochium trichocladiopsis TaxID=1682393 RepID=A0A9P8YIQ9_9PEZI|nr:ASST-domain-containing protein [Microdochium trichocladiopsis]KAH7041241.1 ASST-domain-containing protein [Microdochium trichocladiopsis]